jgi:ribosome recycling factor
MSVNDIIGDAKTRMDKAIENLQHSLNGLRTGRASVSLLDPVKVSVYGSMMPLNQVASVSAPESRLLSVQVWDQNNAAAVEKAIAESGLGLNPIREGQVIRIPIPDLTEERRRELTKKAKEYCENCKIAVRNIRRDANDALKKLEKDKEISEDDLKLHQEEIQKVTDEHTKRSDQITTKKNEEIMTV